MMSAKMTIPDLLNPIQDGLFGGSSWMGGQKGPLPLPKICHRYPTLMKLGTKKLNESRDILLEFCWHQYFFTENQQILLYQEMQI